ncbi:DNA polymerase [Caudoviricetes sp.]|nr:DNA polymerase [Caudoviricetes sp.]
MKQPKPVTVDFETTGIEARPKYPPIPVGVSIKWPGKKSRYYGWGHPTKNNCTFGEARDALVQAYANKDGILCQNGKFDVDVAEVHMDLEPPSWDRIHDTLFLLFLDDPHQLELGLKPSAERLLGLPPEEQDAVADWLCANQPVPGVKISRSKNSDHYFGRYISLVPGDIVGPYANGDTDRTEALFNLLWPKTVERGMLPAYDRERRLMPVLLRMERRGVQVDLRRLKADVATFTEVWSTINHWVIKQLKAPADINLDSGEQLVEAMVKAKKADPAKMPLTATGKFQTNKEALLLGVSDKSLLGVLKYRTQLKTALGTFMRPWLEMAEATGGTIHTTWNQVKAPSGDANVGTRTGRLSATWFMNMPKEFSPIFAHEEADPKKAKALVKCPIPGLPSLPLCRSYITPFPGHVLIDRDYSQQEPRILAHFDGGQLMEKYLEDNWIDFHDYAKAELEKMGKFYGRKPVKNTNLGLIYGMGAPKLAVKNNMSVEEADELKKAILVLYPGLKAMYKDMKIRAAMKQPVRTWGGREYYCEEPRLIQGRIRQFDYKLVNVLIQGSAADCTKEAIIRFDDALIKAGLQDLWFLILSVHDQLTASVPTKDKVSAMELLRVCMEGIEFEVPMLSEGAVSATNWAELIDYDKKGKIL